MPVAAAAAAGSGDAGGCRRGAFKKAKNFPTAPPAAAPAPAASAPAAGQPQSRLPRLQRVADAAPAAPPAPAPAAPAAAPVAAAAASASSQHKACIKGSPAPAVGEPGSMSSPRAMATGAAEQGRYFPDLQSCTGQYDGRSRRRLSWQVSKGKAVCSCLAGQ